MSDLSKSSTNKSIQHGLSRIFMRSVKDLGHSKKVSPATASSNIPKSCETLSSKKAPDGSCKEVEVKEKTDATHCDKRGRNLKERNADKSETACKNKDRRKSIVKSTRGTGRLSGKGKPHNVDSHIKSCAGSRSASLDEKCHAPHSLAVSDSKGNEKHDKNKVIVEASVEDWSLEIVDKYKDITDAVNEHTDKKLLKDSGCVSDFNNNRSSFKLFGSLSSNGSTEVFDADYGKNSESDFVDVWKEGNGGNTEDNQVNSSDKDLVGCVSSGTKLCSEELIDGGNKHLPFHSTPKKHRPEEIFVTLEEKKAAVSPMDGNSVISNGRNKLEISNSRHTGYKDAKNSGRFSTQQRGGDSYFKSYGRHYGNYPRRDDRDLPPRFRFREKGEHCHSDYSKEEQYFTNQRFVKGRDTLSVSQHVSGYQSSRPILPGQSSWRKEQNEGTNRASPLMDLQIKTPKNYKKKQPEMCAEGSKVNKIKWTLPVSEDWLSEIQEIETYDGQNNLVMSHSRQNDGCGIQVNDNENSCRSVGSADKGIVSILPSNSTEEYQELLEDLEYERNTETKQDIKPYIPPLPPGFDNDDVKIAEQTEGYDTVNTSEKVPYLPPIPDEIQQKHDDFNEIGDKLHVKEGALNVIDNLKITDTVTVVEEPSSVVTSYTDNMCSDTNFPNIRIEGTFEKIIQESGVDQALAPVEHRLFAKEPEQMRPNQNVPLNANLKKWKGIDVLMSMNEDSSSVSSIVKTEDPCAYSVFGSTSEADISDCCLDDSKLLENVASQSSDGELIQGVKHFENEIMESGVRRQSLIDHSSSSQFHSPSYEQYARYWYEQQLVDLAYLGSHKFQPKESDYFPCGYEAYGQWYQNMWYEQMRYRWEMYYRQYTDSSCSPEYDVYNQYHADNKYQYRNEPFRPRKCTQGDDVSSKNTGSVNSCGHFAVNATETKKLVETVTTPNTANGKVEGSKSCSGSVDIGKEDFSGDSPNYSGPKLSKYWSSRMERWVQKQHSIVKDYQGSNISVDNKSENGMVPPSIRKEDSSKFSGRQTNAVGGASLSSENVDAVVEESAMPEGIKQETDLKKARSSSDVKRGQSKEGVNADSGTRSDFPDCSCKALDVLYIVWRTCKCSAGNPPKVHQILPCNHDDRSLDLGYQSYESLEHDETVGKLARNTARVPGFLIHPLNTCGANKKDVSEKSKSTGTADEGTRHAKLLIDEDRLQPPPGFACPYTALSRIKEMENSEANVDKTEINNDTMPLKSRQPLTLKELIKQQNLLERSVGSYSPSDAENLNKNGNYSDMPHCLAASAAHLDEAVKSMGSAEEMEKSLVNALRVVNKRILDIQKNMNEQNKSEVNSDRKERSGSATVEMFKADSKQVLNLENGNVECLGTMPSKVVGMNVKDISLPSSTSSFYDQYDQQRSFGLNKKHVDVDKFYKTDETERRKMNVPGSDKKLNNSHEDETMTPLFEIPENEMMETESKDKMRMSNSDNNPKRISHGPPSPFSSVPLPYRFPFRPPPFYHSRMEHLNGAPMRPPSLPIPYQWPAPPFMCDPALVHNPWSDLDMRSRPVGPYFEKYSFADGHPRPTLSCSNMSEGPEDCKVKDAGNMKAPEFRPQQKTCGLKCALKLIESYDSSDDNDNDDSPDIRPFDIKSIEDTPKFEGQKQFEVEKPNHKKLKKDKGYDWSPEYIEGTVGEMDTTNTSIKQSRSRKLKQKSLKAFKSTDRSVTINSVASDPVCKADVTKQVIKKKTLADIISEGRINAGERLGSRDDNELSPFSDGAEKKLPDFPPLPPFPNSPFWCMYAPEKTSALSGHSPVESSSERASFGGLQQCRKSHDSPFRRYSVSPGSGLYSPSETDSEKTSSRSDWKKNFKLFHNFGVKYIDTHCHLDFLFNRENFKGTFKAYMDKHSETFPDLFEGCVAVFCNPSSFNPKVGLWLEVAKESNVWIAMGCHPKNATDFTAAAEYGLEKCMRHTKCIALGEIGLDYSGTFRRHEEVQKQVFRCQLKMAVHLGKPLVIHSRDAEDDCIEILKEIVPRHWKIHCHCFTNAYSNATLWMDEFPNLFIGVTPLVTYRSATPTHDLARKIPLDKLLLETDAPYFIPRCIPREDLSLSNPGLAITVAKEIAKYQDVPVARVLRQCRLNTKAMYGI